MLDLTNKEAIEKIDELDALGTTENLVKQAETAWNEATALDLLKIENITNIVFCGMGASMYGALVLKSILGRNLPYPIEIVSDYYLPDYVGKNTLVVLTSYSGTTEEVLSCAEDAKSKEAQMVVITKGGPLAEFARDNNVSAYIFNPELNPHNVPRLGTGYTVLGMIGLLNKVGVIDIEEKEVTDALVRLHEKFDEIKAQALQDHEIFVNKIPIVFAAEQLSGNALILRNQFNETSKTFSAFYLIPDLNHHLMEGLQFPVEAPLHFIVLNSPNYSDKIKKRFDLTEQVVNKNNYPVHEFETSGQTIYDDVLEVLLYGSFLTLYLGLHYEQNPGTNPWVDWFKKELVA
jgi:glucose/mannose-6-phosphate isomerase